MGMEMRIDARPALLASCPFDKAVAILHMPSINYAWEIPSSPSPHFVYRNEVR